MKRLDAGLNIQNSIKHKEVPSIKKLAQIFPGETFCVLKGFFNK